MSTSKLSPAARKAILSSVATEGAAPLVQGNHVSRNQIAKSLAAAVALLAVDQSADAGTIVVQNPNVTVGFNAGDLSKFNFNLNTGNPGGMKSQGMALIRGGGGTSSRSIHIADGGGNGGGPAFFKTIGNNTAKPFAAGVTWNGVGGDITEIFVSAQTSSAGATPFTNEYYLFYFEDSSNAKHYGWILGSLTSNSYHLTSYAYETTAGVTIAAGDTVGSTVPEPSSLALGAMGALVLGAAGVRKWKKDRQAKAV
jgi:hypothetical protein